MPIPDPVVEAQRERQVIHGEMPNPSNPPKGCVFHPRCPLAIEKCSKVIPELREVSENHLAACIRTPNYGPV